MESGNFEAIKTVANLDVIEIRKLNPKSSLYSIKFKTDQSAYQISQLSLLSVNVDVTNQSICQQLAYRCEGLMLFVTSSVCHASFYD